MLSFITMSCYGRVKSVILDSSHCLVLEGRLTKGKMLPVLLILLCLDLKIKTESLALSRGFLSITDNFTKPIFLKARFLK